MNRKRGVARLLIVLLAAGGFAAILIIGQGQGWSNTRELIVTWLVFLLMGLAGYCVLRLLQLIVRFLRRVLNMGKNKAEKTKLNFHKEFKELTLISALICSGTLFFISFAIFSKGMNPDYLTSLIASFIVFIFSLGLAWLAYAIIMFVVKGFAGESSKAAAARKYEEQFLNTD